MQVIYLHFCVIAGKKDYTEVVGIADQRKEILLYPFSFWNLLPSQND